MIDLNKKLYDAKEGLRKKRKYEEHLKRLNDSLQEQSRKSSGLKNQLLKEKKDVEALEKFTLTNIFYTMIGKKLEKLDKEQEEVLAVQVKYTETLNAIEDIKKEICEYEKKLASVADADIEYEEIIREKEQYLIQTNSPLCEELFALTEEEAEISSQMKEYNEAILAGTSALNKLKTALDSLDSAKGWSTFDMVGGGFFTTAIKHSKIDEAETQIHNAQNQLRRFQEELMDIKDYDRINIDMGMLLTFADYFLDGFIVDWFIHGKINDAYDQMMETTEKVQKLLNYLKETKNQLEERQNSIIQKRKEILEM